MQRVDRSPSRRSELTSGRDTKFISNVRFTLRCAAASRLLRGIFGSTAFSALAACGQSSSVQTTLSDAAAGSAAKPAVTLVATKSSIAMGTPATLRWSAKDAQTCAASGGWSGTQPTSGTVTTDPLTATTSYTLTCSGPGGSASQSAEVVVTTLAPTVTLSASPTTIANGGTSTLSWNAANATACTASGSWHGAVATNGTWSTGALSDTTEYELTCTGAGGSATQSATVTVSALPPLVTLSAGPSTVASGAASTLAWSTKNAASCSASGAWSGTKALSGSQSSGTLTANATYTLTCTGAGGSATQSATVSVKSTAPTVSIRATPSTLAKGTSSTLSWNSANATSCTASGAWSGGKPMSGSQSTGVLAANATYTLTCSGPGGTAVQSTTVSIKSPTPTVSLSVGPSAITTGSSATLNWTAANATGCTASGAWSGAKALSGSQSTGALTASATYTLTCTGAGGSAAQSATVSVKSPAPTVSLSVNPSSVIKGSSSLLTWSAANATSCSASGGWSGGKALSGSQSTGALSANATYALTCSGTGGSATQSTTVTVSPKPTATVALSASPSTVASGGSSNLTWVSTNATACTASGAWSGSKATSGSQSSGALKANATYVLTCTGAGGSATQTATISVTAPAPTVSLFATPSTVKSGAASMLTWSSTNATTCTASGGWSGSKSISGSQSSGSLTVNTTYSLTCVGTSGSATQSATVSVTAPAPTVTLTASPSTVARGNASVLSWSSTNATSCTASGAWSGGKAVSGSQSTGTVTANETYGLSCTGNGGSAAQSATVSVTSPTPTVTFAASPSTVSSGGSSTLTWSATNATSCSATGGWSGTKAASGSQSTGALTANKSYGLTCTGSGGSATQLATVSVTKAAPALTLSASPSTVKSGAASMLAWSSTNTTACVASGGWSGTKPTSGSSATANLSATTKFMLTCTGAGGSASQSATVTTSATPPSVSISASPSSVASGGSSTLTWSSTNATACTASGAWSGSMATSGSQATGAMTATKTYALSCTGAGGTATQSATVAVNAVSPVPPPTGLSCTGTSGSLALKAKAVRDTGISPLLVFFDATGTTDTSISKTTTFQDVSYTWNFGDTGASGTDTWGYGSNKGHNSRNTATGGVAAHLYVTPGVDTAYVVTVTAHNGTNTASCQIGVTAHDPAGANGFAGTKTTCVSASGTPTPGSGGCPAGAAALSTSSFNTALGSLGSGKRVLFKCGDKFTGDNATLNGTTWSVGAYGGCEGTQSNQPIFNDTAGTGNYQINVSPNAGDGRISDIYFNGNGSAGGAVAMGAGPTQAIPYQVTLWNLQSTGNAAGYYWAQGAQWGLIGSTQLNSRGNIAVFLNSNANNPTEWNGTYPNLDYQAAMGNFVNGVGSAGGSGAGIEAFRVGACRLCVFENNTIENANNIGGVFKLHNGNTNGSLPTWTGIYTELIEISDNLFTGNSGAIASDIAPQNGGVDERLRNFVIERNLYSASTTAWGGELLMLSGANMTVRDNVFYMPAASSTIYAAIGVQFAQRGSGNLLTVQYNEAYNNTCYAPNSEPSQICIGFNTMGARSAPSINSVAKNNLFYTPSKATGPTVDNTGSGNRHQQSRLHEWQRRLQLDHRLQTDRELPRWHQRAGLVRCPRSALGTDLGSRRRAPLNEK